MCKLMKQLIDHNPEPVDKHVTLSALLVCSTVLIYVGAYLYEQYGFISSLTYDIPEAAPWEIAIDEKGGGDSSVGELPHMIRVSNLAFTPIHNFLPQKPNVANSPDERYIALSRNYGKGLYNLNYRQYKADGDGDNNNTNNIPGE